jgi:hypothetical protein
MHGRLGRRIFLPFCTPPTTCPPLDRSARRTFSDSAIKNMLSEFVETSKANGLLILSSAPLMDRHLLICTKRKATFIQ